MADKVLDGKVVVVTGASAGIGSAICEVLAAAGARVVMGARRPDRMAALQKAIEETGGKAVYRKTDVTVKQEVKDLIKFAETTFGPVDVLINNAAIVAFSLMKNVNEEEWEKVVDVNCKGVLNGIGAVISGMVERKKGHILNISSDSGRKSSPGLAVYSGSKFFVEGLSRALRQEVCQYGVKVTCIQPGMVKSEIFDHCTKDAEAMDMFGAFMKDCPILEAEDIARAVLYVLSQPDNVAVGELMIHPKETALDF